MTDTETDNITEQEYILLANDFKLKYDELKRKLFLKNILFYLFFIYFDFLFHFSSQLMRLPILTNF